MNTHADLLAKANVTFVGEGYKNDTRERAIVCGVTRKVPEGSIRKRDRIPKHVRGRRTDVVETGVIRALRTSRHRPAPGGVSIGHHAITAGTLGCVMRDGQGRRVILSNNHVLANSNDAEIGDSIYQPGPHDGGTSSDRIARLEDFVAIAFQGEAPSDCPVGDLFTKAVNAAAKMLGSRTRIRAVRAQDEENLVDAAVALPVGADLVLDTVIDLGKPDAVRDAALGDKVTKSGRTTGTTEDEITAVSATVDVNYGAGKTARFANQLIAGPMSQGGDSGSVVFLQGTQTLVGLLFAGSEQTTVMNQMSDVVRLLGLTL